MLRLKMLSIVFFSIITLLDAPGSITDNYPSSLSPEEALQDILQMSIDWDFDSYVEHVVDLRIPKEEQKTMYMVWHAEHQLVDVKILDAKSIFPKHSEVRVQLSFKNGEIIEQNLHMEKIRGEWKFIIKEVPAEEVKIIKEGRN